MGIAVLLEPLAKQRFRATSTSPMQLAAEGDTRELAIENLQHLISERLAGGAELISIEVGLQSHSLGIHAGELRQDPLLDEWKQAMVEYRLQREAELDAV